MIFILLSDTSTSLVPAKFPSASMTFVSATVRSGPRPLATTSEALKIPERASLPLFSPSTIFLAVSSML